MTLDTALARDGVADALGSSFGSSSLWVTPAHEMPLVGVDSGSTYGEEVGANEFGGSSIAGSSGCFVSTCARVFVLVSEWASQLVLSMAGV
eukprot:14260676-Ditylum_brightwellii.AAC.1